MRDIAAAWCADPAHAESFPPMVFNITDGEATDCDDAGTGCAVADQIKSLRTADGNVLLVNIHIAAGTPNGVFFPRPHEASVYEPLCGEVLYDRSSEPMPRSSARRPRSQGPGDPLPRSAA